MNSQAKMTPYPEYKATNLPWLPQIPAHWDTLKVKYAFSERSEKGFPNEPLLAATQTHGVIPKSIYETRTVEAQKDLHLLKLVKVGDFVISLRSFQGGIEYAYYQGIISPAYTIMIPNNAHIISDYFKYLAKSKPFVKLLQTCVTGIRKGQNIDYNTFKRNSIPIPSVAEQELIVRYLDSMTVKINKLIRAKKKQIALKIEMLNVYLFSENASCISLGYWDNSFPNSWHKEKASKIFQERNSKGFVDKDLLAVTQTRGVLFKKDCPQHFVQPSDFTKQKLVCPQDFIISLRSFQGGIETSFLEGLVSAAYSVFCLRTSSLLLTTYFQYLFKTPVFVAYLNTLVKDIRDGKKISFTDFRESLLPIPPQEHLEKIKSLSDEINILKKQLEKTTILLNEYKKSLIASVVTGQVDVRNIQVEEFDPADLITETDDDPAEDDDQPQEESEE